MTADKFSQIGSNLVSASKEIERTPGEILQELFPYVYEASRRMSARQISKWLEEQHGIQISQPTISRALRNPKMFEDWFTENIEPTARRIVSSLNVSMTELLFDDSDNAAYRFALAEDAAKKSLSDGELKEIDEGFAYLREKWFPLSVGTRRALYPEKTQEQWEDERANDAN
jgi:hypothetical protein